MEMTLSASEFKAKCLGIMKRLGDNRLTRVTVTRHGKPVAVMIPPAIDEETARSVFGSMAGTVHIAPGVDLTEPIFEGEMDAVKGILYR